MSRLWSHTDYAEDQPHYRAILTTHVLHRGFQAGAIAGSIIGPVTYLLRGGSVARHLLFPAMVRSAGVGAVIGTGLMTIMLPLRMWKREEIEWKDRSWRLLENKGQVEVDTWSVGGIVLGATVLAATRGRGAANGLGWKTVVGSLGLGNTAGVMGYMVWRHGINAGKWPEPTGPGISHEVGSKI